MCMCFSRLGEDVENKKDVQDKERVLVLPELLRAERSGLGHQRHHQASSEEGGHLRVGSWADDSVEVPA